MEAVAEEQASLAAQHPNPSVVHTPVGTWSRPESHLQADARPGTHPGAASGMESGTESESSNAADTLGWDFVIPGPDETRSMQPSASDEAGVKGEPVDQGVARPRPQPDEDVGGPFA